MADDAASDMLMFMVAAPGSRPLAAESTADIVGGGELMSGFLRGKFFEVENFSFGMELVDDEGGEELDGSEKRSYARWRGLRDATAKPNPPFRAEPGDMSVSRKIDSSSPILLRHCLRTQEFDQAVLVKRARPGQSGSMIAVLRLEFRKIWIRSIDWEDGDTVRETVKFRFGAVSVTYAKQAASGQAGRTFPCNWAAYQPSAS